MARFIVSQRTDHGVPHRIACRALDISESWFYKWRDRGLSVRAARRVEIDRQVKKVFDDFDGTYGSPRVTAELRDGGVRVAKKMVEASMRRQGLVARPRKARRGLTRSERQAVAFEDLVKRDFTAARPDVAWVGDMTEVPTGEGKLYLATVLDLFSRRLVGWALSERCDAELARAAINVAVATRGGEVAGVIFHSDRGSTYTATTFTAACERLGIVQSMGRVGSCFDNAVAESFFSTFEFELRSQHAFATIGEARRQIADYIDFYNSERRHSVCGNVSPIQYEHIHYCNTRSDTLKSDQAA